MFNSQINSYAKQIRLDFIHLTQNLMKRPFNHITKQLQDTLMNYFLENYVSSVLKVKMNLPNCRAVKQKIEIKAQKRAEQRKYMRMINAYVAEIEVFRVQKEYLDLLSQLIAQENTFERGCDQWKTLIRKKMIALILYVHYNTENRETVLTDFNDMWQIIFKDHSNKEELTFFPRKRSIFPSKSANVNKKSKIANQTKSNKKVKVEKKKQVEESDTEFSFSEEDIYVEEDDDFLNKKEEERIQKIFQKDQQKVAEEEIFEEKESQQISNQAQYDSERNSEFEDLLEHQMKASVNSATDRKLEKQSSSLHLEFLDEIPNSKQNIRDINERIEMLASCSQQQSTAVTMEHQQTNVANFPFFKSDSIFDKFIKADNSFNFIKDSMDDDDYMGKFCSKKGQMEDEFCVQFLNIRQCK